MKKPARPVQRPDRRTLATATLDRIGGGAGKRTHDPIVIRSELDPNFPML